MAESEMEVLSRDDLRSAWAALALPERLEGFRLLPASEADAFFVSLSSLEQAELLQAMPEGERRLWMRLLAPDDAADLIQNLELEDQPAMLGLLDAAARREVQALLAYAEDAAGGLMSPRFARLRPDMRVGEALSYVRLQARERQVETIYYLYVLDAEQRLLGVVSFRELFSAPDDKKVREVMRTQVISVLEDTDQEVVSRLFSQHGLMAIPVLDSDGRLKGIVTIDDIVDVVREEATEDIQKVGGMEALDAPYFEIDFPEMLRKRAGWLTLLFLGEMLTATAMGHYEHEIARAVVLALFVPLIISSGGNSGSQATSLIIRALALGEMRLRDWWRVLHRELIMGLVLGLILGVVGITRIVMWERAFGTYGEHYLLIALTVGASLVGVVLWGTMAGSMLPFILRRLGFDPASASAPFVATLVDVSGLVIYFTVASLILAGTLL